ncbi:hypothetical protein [Azospirillum canadense]|uniref:hypothetical protein n=1 Tax=Azospirillum canadense TaxID=403962 RepID=UPI002226A95B|nr:hypothetical protein [Azospirillum canadense]MCW2239218.1 DNA polymerase/3'-5' exonuclease PolX [Azospirillum canadense]
MAAFKSEYPAGFIGICIVAAQGPRNLAELIAQLEDLPIPALARAALLDVAEHIETSNRRIAALEAAIMA